MYSRSTLSSSSLTIHLQVRHALALGQFDLRTLGLQGFLINLI